jgi:hypothetical protein
MRNVPILEGMRLGTGDDGYAEAEFEEHIMVRLTPVSVVGLLGSDSLSDRQGMLSTKDLPLRESR